MTATSYGAWPSSLSAELIGQGSRRLKDIQVDGDYVYWLETDASDGRSVLMRRGLHTEAEEVLPKEYSVKSSVHEYGGGDYLAKDGRVLFANKSDQAWYLFEKNEIRRITPSHELPTIRYADADMHLNFIVLVREQHLDDDVVNEIVLIDLHQSDFVQLAASGADFYASPRFSEDGSKLCWIQWNHPNMPWDESELWVASFDGHGAVFDSVAVSAEKNVSVMNPSWHEGKLYCISDQLGYWQLGVLHDDEITILTTTKADHVQPPWVFKTESYCFIDSHTVAITEIDNALETLVLINLETKVRTPVATEFTSFGGYCFAFKDGVITLAASPYALQEVTYIELETGKATCFRKEAEIDLSQDDISVGEAITFKGYKQRKTHAFFYPPKNCNHEASKDELPPLIVLTHGGPSGHVNNGLNLKIQFFTTRGFAVVDVNYAGSTGFGRAYRERLKGEWGVADIKDAVAASKYLAKENKVDEKRTVIMGSSAGGYTTLAALTFTDYFAAGASLYGIGDLLALVAHTHKFEAHYTQNLLNAHEVDDPIYQARSPICHTEKLSCPMILLQGLNDFVVPPEQATAMAHALDSAEIPYAHIEYEGEGHGFRKAETVAHSLNSIWYFFLKVLGVQPPTGLAAIEVKYL